MFGCNGGETLQPEESNAPSLIENLLFGYREGVGDVTKCCDSMWRIPESIRETSHNLNPSNVKMKIPGIIYNNNQCRFNVVVVCFITI